MLWWIYRHHLQSGGSSETSRNARWRVIYHYTGIEFIDLNMSINMAFSIRGTVYFSRITAYTYLLEDTDVRVLVLGGNLDPDT